MGDLDLMPLLVNCTLVILFSSLVVLGRYPKKRCFTSNIPHTVQYFMGKDRAI